MGKPEDLFEAVKNGNVDEMKRLTGSRWHRRLLRHRDKNGETVAHIAAECGEAECLRIIAEIAPDSLAAASKAGWTAAHMAAAGNHADCFRVIAETAPHSLSAEWYKCGWNAAHLSVAKNHRDCLEVIAEFAPDSLTALDKVNRPPAQVTFADEVVWVKNIVEKVAQRKRQEAAKT